MWPVPEGEPRPATAVGEAEEATSEFCVGIREFGWAKYSKMDGNDFFGILRLS